MNLSITIHLCFAVCIACGQTIPEKSDKKEPRRTDKMSVEKINGKSISFYLDHPDVSEIAKRYYRKQFTISDDDATFSLMDSILTTNTQTRPFYFFLYNQIMKKSDGAVSEAMAYYSASFISKFPCEFLFMKDDKTFDVDLQKWAQGIAFSFDDPAQVSEYINGVSRKISKGCTSMSSQWDAMSTMIKAASN